MKNLQIVLSIFLLTAILCSCDKNEVMPSYTKKGTATATVATIASSKATAALSESITLTLMYVNPSSDPLQTVELKAKIGAGAYTTVQKFNAQGEAKDVQIKHDVQFVTPATAATVTFDVVITSQKEYPQTIRTTVSVK